MTVAGDEEQPEQTGADQQRRTEPLEQALPCLVRDLADRMRGARDEISALARRVLQRLGQMGDAVLDRVLGEVPLGALTKL